MKLKGAVIGAAGYWGKNYIRLLHNHPDIDLVVAVDSNFEGLNKIKEAYPDVNIEFNLGGYDDIDFVVVCTPLETHFDIVSKMMMAKKNVLCEKVFTSTGEKASALAFWNKNGVVKLGVGHTFLFNNLVRHIKKLLDENALGEILYMTFQRTGKSPIRKDCNANFDLAGHDISMVLYWLGEMPKSVTSFGKSYLQTGIEDVCFSTLEFSNNVVAHLHCSWYEPIKQRRVTIVGREKMLVFDDVAQTIVIYDNKGEHKENVEYKEPLRAQVDDFISAIINDHEPFVSAEDGQKVVEVLEMCQVSMKDKSRKVFGYQNERV